MRLGERSASRCRTPHWVRRILPLGVRRRRFFVPLWVFILLALAMAGTCWGGEASRGTVGNGPLARNYGEAGMLERKPLMQAICRWFQQIIKAEPHRLYWLWRRAARTIPASHRAVNRPLAP